MSIEHEIYAAQFGHSHESAVSAVWSAGIAEGKRLAAEVVTVVEAVEEVIAPSVQPLPEDPAPVTIEAPVDPVAEAPVGPVAEVTPEPVAEVQVSLPVVDATPAADITVPVA